MTEPEALVIAARRYCIENHDFWVKEYMEKRTGSDFPYSYSENDYNLFPRYNALNAILQGIELYDGSEFENIDNCKETLKSIGQSSQSPFTTGRQNKIENKAIQEERYKFTHFINNIKTIDLNNIEALPYRRRLKESERNELRQKLQIFWDFNGSYWVPLVDIRPDITTIFFLKENLEREDIHAIKNLVEQNSTGRFFEITEDQLDYETEASELTLDCYETIYCDRNLEWVVYGSHEGTVSFGGKWLVAFIESLFNGRQNLINNW